ncbi:2-oxo-4-hydroxy-4-carboxy-5-ureidoimidazoline decarboxylase [Streptomyces uncialis]|nr:2-oxo-4-hydroxy-4-carboxy-5-ureidoimidazoline decarboxylase [Streptomyces uncialis]MCX4660641.1 2-oxo-4-hydroxy-4-carboxy-5-ureidoimidazoline decarboxylase [Streptomyces uncialis]
MPSQGFPRPPGRAAVPSQQRTPAPAPPPVTPSGLVRLNTAAPADALTAFLGCCASHRWAQRLTAHRPYRDLETLLAAADEAAYDLAHADLTEALARESRTHPAGGPGQGYSAADTALSAAHAAYESRFGHAFVLCLDDCPPEETLDRVLAAIRTRLGHDPDDERAVTAEELRRLARGRLTRLSRTGPVDDDRVFSDTGPADPAIPEGTGPGQEGRKSTGSGRPDSPYASV